MDSKALDAIKTAVEALRLTGYNNLNVNMHIDFFGSVKINVTDDSDIDYKASFEQLYEDYEDLCDSVTSLADDCVLCSDREDYLKQYDI
jgi:hypothetical protein